MIASRLGVVVAFAVALVLGVVLAIDLSREAPIIGRALVPGFDGERVTALRWRRSCPAASSSCIAVVELRKTQTGWQWTSDGAPAERIAVDAVVSALRGAHWQRRGDGDLEASSTAESVELEVITGARTTKLRLGAAVAGGAQAWIVRDGQRLLVDDWIPRALAPEPLALRVRKPFTEVASASRMVLEQVSTAMTIRIEGTPRHLVKPFSYLLVPVLVRDLEVALAALEIVGLSPPAGTAAPANDTGWTITIDAPLLVTIDILGVACVDDASQVAIGGSAGTGCVTRAAVDAIDRAARALLHPSTALDPRPLPIEPVRVTLADGSVLDLSKRLRIGDRDADPARATELVNALATAAEVIAAPTTPPLATIVVEDRAGTKHTLGLFADRTVARAPEPMALRLAPELDAIVRRPGHAFADTRLYTEEPTTISSIAIDGTTYVRGDVLGEWTRTGPGADLPGVVEQLAALLAMPRSIGPHAADRPSKTIVVTITPPAGAPRTRTLMLVTLPTGCGAIVEGAKHLLAPEVCQLAARLR